MLQGLTHPQLQQWADQEGPCWLPPGTSSLPLCCVLFVCLPVSLADPCALQPDPRDKLCRLQRRVAGLLSSSTPSDLSKQRQNSL